VPLALAQREIALAAVALLAAVVGLAIASGRGGSTTSQPLPARVGDWQHAAAAQTGRDLQRRTTACGVHLTPTSTGVAHPVLPCGAKLYIGYGNQEVLTQVIARGPEQPGLQFGLTRALAQALGVRGTVTVRWVLAARS
jgi:hypothetical protein